MDPESFVEPEIAVTAAITAVLFSPRARKVIRKGLVYGIAGILTVGETVTSFAKNVGQGMQQASMPTSAEGPEQKETVEAR